MEGVAEPEESRDSRAREIRWRVGEKNWEIAEQDRM